jgi:hypothetical protein
MPLEILHLALVLFCSRARFVGAEIATLAGLRIELFGNKAGSRPIAICGSWNASSFA